ncbi:glycoside hydrolase family 18 protein [Lentithecium fluviatile CBS 122367]|uniref:chitinase n=1 Tax=Lentithecium fluviatile CBS 122367 TaxID=1168545 RepID=A0A6G1JK11_9PLEO|nr:glycoside hydrolase family 18 protein [Lentithecium fluviatile CBS 122367]
MFGPGKPGDVVKPFFDAGINGFDLDVETDTTYLVPFAKNLRALMGSDHYLTAAPECPDSTSDENNLKELLAEKDLLNITFVQFYNTPYFSFSKNNGGKLTIDKWNQYGRCKQVGGTGYIESICLQKDMNNKFLMGFLAGLTAARSGYLKPEAMATVVKEAKGKNSFGGVMLCDASQAWNNGEYHKVKEAPQASNSASPMPSAT